LPFLGVLGCATLGDSWRKRGFAVVVRYAIVTQGKRSPFVHAKAEGKRINLI